MITPILALVGLLCGGMAAYWAFVVLWFTPLKDLFPVGLIPVGIAAAISFFLGWVEPEGWHVLAISVALPSVLMAALFLIAGDGAMGWVVVAGVAVGVCVIAGWLGRKAKES